MRDVNQLDNDYAGLQVARLSVIGRFPADPGARVEVMRALRMWCVGRRIDGRGASCYANEQCKAVVDDAIITLRGWKGPAQLKEIYDDLFPPRPMWGKDGPME